MNKSYALAEKMLLAPANIQATGLESILHQLMMPKVDMADLYLQMSRNESWVLEDGIVKEGSFDISRGIGARAVSGEKTGFAYADAIEMPVLQQIAQAARSIVHSGQTGKVIVPANVQTQALYSMDDPLVSVSTEDKIDLMHRLNKFARAQDPRIEQVIVSLAGSYEVILVINSLGTMATDVRPLVRCNVSVIAHENGKREHASMGGGGRCGYEMFFQNDKAFDYAKEAVRLAVLNLNAKPAPAGTMPVVLGAGWPGILLHEAIGHGLEGDFNRKGTSAFTGCLGQRVASDDCTVVDDGTLLNRRGSLNVDDEGTITQCTTLIENGILKGYLQDKLNAKLMGMQPTGNGRRESYAHLPMPRMTNTYMLPGKRDPREIIASVKKGLYAVTFAGGQVDITSGKFVFSAQEAYLIEDGKVTTPVRGATLIGHGPEVLTKVSMVGNDLELDPGIGTCGKDGQSVPVGVGQPTLKIEELTVGGTAA